MSALQEIGLQSSFIAKDIYSPTQRENVLFILYLYNSLPHYLPKSTIEFSCILGETLVKYVELSNPTLKTICYWVKLEGHGDFTIESDKVKLEAKSTVKFPITYISRVSIAVTGIK